MEHYLCPVSDELIAGEVITLNEEKDFTSTGAITIQ
jgi:hypothetical protein